MEEKEIPVVDLSDSDDSVDKTTLVDVLRSGANIEASVHAHLTLREQWRLARALFPVEANNGVATTWKWNALFNKRVDLFQRYQSSVKETRAAAIAANFRIGRLDYKGIARIDSDASATQAFFDTLSRTKSLYEKAKRTFPKVGQVLHWREKEWFRKDLTEGEIYPETTLFYPEARIVREDHTKGLALGSVQDSETNRRVRLRALPKALGIVNGRKKLAILVRWCYASEAPQICLWEPTRDWLEGADYTRAWNLAFVDVQGLSRRDLEKVIQDSSLGMVPVKKGYRESIPLFWTSGPSTPIPEDLYLSKGFGPRTKTMDQEARWMPEASLMKNKGGIVVGRP